MKTQEQIMDSIYEMADEMTLKHFGIDDYDFSFEDYPDVFDADGAFKDEADDFYNDRLDELMNKFGVSLSTTQP